jgi:tetratricopeptide (TPR) repeat protein
MGDALQSIGDLAGSKRELLAAVELYGRPIPREPSRMALAIVKGLITQSAHRALPARWLSRPDQGARALLDTAKAYDRLMQTCYYRGEYGPMFLANLTMLNLVERGPVTPSLATAYTNAAAVAGIVPLPRVAARYFELAERVLERAYHPEVESHLRLLLAHYEGGRGNWQKAITAVERALVLTLELGYVRRWEDGAGVRSNLAWGRNFDESLAWCSAMHRSASRRGDAQVVSWGLLRRAELHAALGQQGELLELLPEVEASAAGQERPEQIRALALRAAYLAAEGRYTDAVALAARAEQLASESKAVHVYCLEAHAHLAHVRLGAWALGFGTREAAEQSFVALRAAARIFPIAVPRLCLHRGSWLWLSGDRKAAVATWKRGHARAQALGLSYDESLLAHTLAVHAPGGTDVEALERAAQGFGSLGIQDATRARALAGVLDLTPNA